MLNSKEKYYMMKTIKILALLPLLCMMAVSCDDNDDSFHVDLSKVSSAEDFVDVRDGKTYKCVQIGDQIWMAENLAYFCEGGTYAGCFTWNQSVIGISNIELEKDVFCDLWTATVEDPAHNWAVDSRFPPETYMSILNSYKNGEYSQAVVTSMIADIAYRPFRDAFNVRRLEYVNNNLSLFQDVFVDHMKEFENSNGHYSETYGFLYSLDAARKAVPEGWRLPTDEDWKKLEATLGMSARELESLNAWRGTGIGDALKMGGATGFEALMGGADHYKGGGAHLYINLDESAYFWANESKKVEIVDPDGDSDEDSADDEDDDPVMVTVREGIIRQVSLYSSQIWRGTIRLDVNTRDITCSVRCVKDAK